MKRHKVDIELSQLGTCLVKIYLSLSRDMSIKGGPKGWTLPIRDVLLYRGAGLMTPLVGNIY